VEAGDAIYLHATGPCLNELMIVPGKLLYGPVPDKVVSPDTNGDAVLTSRPSVTGASGFNLYLGYPCGELPGQVCNGNPPLLATVDVEIVPGMPGSAPETTPPT
jgi:hypothetical protein